MLTISLQIAHSVVSPVMSSEWGAPTNATVPTSGTAAPFAGVRDQTEAVEDVPPPGG